MFEGARRCRGRLSTPLFTVLFVVVTAAVGLLLIRSR
jgi:hypothetical protein